MLIGSIYPVLTVAALLGACVWIGGFVAVIVVVRVARAQLEPATQVPFLRGFGRSYLPVASVGLALALAAGGGLLSSRPWSGTAAASVAVAGALLATLVIGVAQARAMTRLRARLLDAPDDEALELRVRRAGQRAVTLRTLIVAESFALLVLAGVLASSRP